MSAGGWLAARCWGKCEMQMVTPGDAPGAHTSPVYVCIGGQPMQPDPAAIGKLQAGLDYMLQWTAQPGSFESERQREKLLGIFQAAKNKLMGQQAGDPR